MPDFADRYKEYFDKDVFRAFKQYDSVPILQEDEKHTDLTPTQSVLCRDQHEYRHEKLVQNLPHIQRGVFLSNCSPGTAHWINSVCMKSPQHKITTNVYSTAVLYRLLLPFIDKDTTVKSICCLDDEEIQEHNAFHPVYCREGTQERIDRHNACVFVLGEAIQKFAQARVIYEHHIRAPDTHDPNPLRVDLHVSFGASQYCIDFTCVSPGAPSYVSAQGPSTATEKAKREKHATYDEAVQANPGMVLLPFVMHDTGHIDDEALQFIDKIFGLDTALPNPDYELKRQRKYFLNTLRTTIIRGNHYMVQKFLSTYSSISALNDQMAIAQCPSSPQVAVLTSGSSPSSYS